MKTYSFRAECEADVDALRELAQAQLVECNWTLRRDQHGLPDIDVEVTTGADQSAVMKLMREILDGHVMIQTLRPVPLSQNSLERDYDVE
jgi:hypothetical protein